MTKPTTELTRNALHKTVAPVLRCDTPVHLEMMLLDAMHIVFELYYDAYGMAFKSLNRIPTIDEWKETCEQVSAIPFDVFPADVLASGYDAIADMWCEDDLNDLHAPDGTFAK